MVRRQLLELHERAGGPGDLPLPRQHAVVHDLQAIQVNPTVLDVHGRPSTNVRR